MVRANSRKGKKTLLTKAQHAAIRSDSKGKKRTYYVMRGKKRIAKCNRLRDATTQAIRHDFKESIKKRRFSFRKQKPEKCVVLDENGNVVWPYGPPPDVAKDDFSWRLASDHPSIELHFNYSGQIMALYKDRDKPSVEKKIISYCKKDIATIEEFIPWYKQMREDEWGQAPLIPNMHSFEKLAIIYEKQGKYEDAIKLSEYAIKLGLHDPKKCHAPKNYPNRIKRLRKKIQQRDA